MERINLNKKELDTHQPNFIGAWNIKNDNLCKEIINFFESNVMLQKKGLVASGIDQNKKKTTEISIAPKDLKKQEFKYLDNYVKELFNCYLDYQIQWPFLKDVIKEVHVGSFNIQKYFPGDHFSNVHSERTCLETSHRILAWMTYLNDVDNGGTTNFTHYDVKVKPEIGKTLIWPAEWTHAHSGEVVNSGVKYIVTGWIHFPHNK